MAPSSPAPTCAAAPKPSSAPYTPSPPRSALPSASASAPSYSENSQATILTQGVLGSLCSGILVYNTYAELIGAQINRGPALRGCSATFRAAGFLAMYVGAGAMAALGLWA